MDTKEKVLELMQSENQPLKTGQVAEKTNIDKKEVDKAIKVLIKEDKIFSPKRCFYAVK